MIPLDFNFGGKVMPKDVSVQKLKEKAKELRLNIVKTANFAGSGHVGGSLSWT